jgi:hypothetical protein
MRGIPVTQVVGAMYLLPSLLGLLRSLTTSTPEGDIQKLISDLTGPSDSRRGMLRETLNICGWYLHLISTIVLLYGVADRIGFSASETVLDVVAVIQLFVNSIGVLYLLQEMMFVLLDKISPVSRFDSLAGLTMSTPIASHLLHL